jgi:hypothetical protein
LHFHPVAFVALYNLLQAKDFCERGTKNGSSILTSIYGNELRIKTLEKHCSGIYDQELVTKKIFIID